MSWEMRQGDALKRLREMEDESVHCVVTSPPYWGLRDYGTGEWLGGDPDCRHTRKNPREDHSHGRWEGTRGKQDAAAANASPMLATCSACGAVREDQQVGLEPTPEEYVAKMVEVFREVRRVLRSDGTCWLNLGDSYQSGRGEAQGVDPKSGARRFGKRPQDGIVPGLKPKDLVGIPWRVAFALQADGWWLRSDIVWAKPNPMPESVRDRPTKAHEYIFLLTKSATYYYDSDAIAEGEVEPSRERSDRIGGATGHEVRHSPGGTMGASAKRNKRTVWTIATRPFPSAHFAVFPPEIPETCIKAGTSEKGCCPECGAPWERVVERGSWFPVGERGGHPSRYGNTDTRSAKGFGMPSIKPTATTLGWEPTCECHEARFDNDDLPPDAPLYLDPTPCTVLDPFAGAGTTLVVAARLGRRAIGIELNPEYVKLAEGRIDSDCPLFNREADDG